MIRYDEDCKPRKKKLRNGKTATIKSSCPVNRVSAYVYTKPEKAYGEKGVYAIAYYSENGAGDMIFVIRKDGTRFKVTREQVQ